MDIGAYHVLELQIASDPVDHRRCMPAIRAEHRRIVDVGCGAGQTLIASRLDANVTAVGIDCDQRALSLGRHLNPNIGLIRARGESLPLANGFFDLAISRVALPYMRTDAALAEMARVLRPGGDLWIVLHPFSIVWDELKASLSERRWRTALHRAYALASGAAPHGTPASCAHPRQGSILPDRDTHRANARDTGIRGHPRRAAALLRRDGAKAGRVMKTILSVALLAAGAALATPSGAAVLYKTVDEKGVVTFSDLPPPPGADSKRLLMPDASSSASGVLRSADATAPQALTEERIRAEDVAVQGASLQVDIAEHALAVARRPLWEPVDLMKIGDGRMSRADSERIAYYQKNLKIAKQQLCDLLRSKRNAEARTMTAEAGMPIYGASSPIYRR